jgi:hypothetical protein
MGAVKCRCGVGRRRTRGSACRQIRLCPCRAALLNVSRRGAFNRPGRRPVGEPGNCWVIFYNLTEMETALSSRADTSLLSLLD